MAASRTLNQARRKNLHAGEPIFSPLTSMNTAKVFIRRGGVTLIAAGPGTGKTALTQSIIQRGNDHGKTNSCLFFSADSGADVVWKRSLAIATGISQDDIDQLVIDGNDEDIAEAEQTIQKASANIRWVTNSAPTGDDMLKEIDGYADIYGAYPEIIVMDNLKNLDESDAEGEFGALEEDLVFLSEIAKDTNAALIALHHVGGEFEDGLKPIPLSGVRGKVGKTPILVLTLHQNPALGMLNVSIVKQRGGQVDTSGKWFIPVKADLGRMQFG